MLSLLFSKSLSVVEYSIVATDLIITGSGSITKNGVRTKGSYTQFKNVVIEEGPSEIGDYAFHNCKSMISITIPKSVTQIGMCVFRFCSSLSKIIVHKDNPNYYCNQKCGLLTKDNTIFFRNPMIENPEFPDGLTDICEDAFSTEADYSYGDISFPSSVSVLHTHTFDSGIFNSICFKGVSQLTSLMGFVYCYIGTLKIPNSVTTFLSSAIYSAEIGAILFEPVSKLQMIEASSIEASIIEEIVFPESLLTVERYAFKGSNIQRITFGTKCSSIDITAFAGCQQLSEVTLSGKSNYFTSSDNVFMDIGKTKLYFVSPSKISLTIPSTVTEIGTGALQNAKLLKSLTIGGGNKWSSSGGVLYSYDFKNLVAVCGGVSDIEIDSRVHTVNEYAANGCTILTTVTFLGNLVTDISDFAFFASGITTFKLPSSVTKIGKEAFRLTVNLTTFTVNEDSHLQSIGDFCFRSSTLRDFYFGTDVTSIYKGAFYHCPNLSTINFHPKISLTTFGNYAFESTAIDKVDLPSSINSISERCFQFCSKMKTFTCSHDSQLKSIGIVAFKDCVELEEVTLPGKCKDIGIDSFSGCTSLVKFSHQATTLGNGAFSSCTKLESFNISGTQTKLDASIFQNCESLLRFSVSLNNEMLKEVDGFVFNSDKTVLILFPPGLEMATIPQKTTSFGENAFAWSPKLKFVAFFSGSNLNTIGTAAFYECKMLTSVQLPSRLTHIKSRSFYGCTSLSSITFPDSLQVIESESFIGCRLRIVKYCGNNIINGTNVFHPSVEIFVTDIYNGKMFCSNKVYHKLSVDCELKQNIFDTCRYDHIIIPRSFTFLSLFILCNC